MVSKSVLVIGTPTSCKECPIYTGYSCHVYRPQHCKHIPEWCPLLPLPECKELITNTNGEANIGNILQYNYAQGYNDCLKDIQKGEANEKM